VIERLENRHRHIHADQLDIVKSKYGIERADDAEKAPFAMQDLLRGAAARRKRSGSLSAIVKAIQALRERRSPRRPRLAVRTHPPVRTLPSRQRLSLRTKPQWMAGGRAHE
jgi:hypothetical protein